MLVARFKKMRRPQLRDPGECGVEEIARRLQVVGAFDRIARNLGLIITEIAFTDRIQGAHEITERAAEVSAVEGLAQETICPDRIERWFNPAAQSLHR